MKFLLLFLLLAETTVQAQVIGDGLPERAGTTTPVNICYTKADRSVVCERFAAPDILRDFADVTYIGASPIDVLRLIESLPTFGLAKFHWWLFGFEVLPHAQTDYARCIGEIRAYQRLLHLSPKIDDPASPLYALIMQIEHYIVPFEPIQRFAYDTSGPPGLEEAKAHARAAIDSVNITVYNTGLCKLTADYFLGQVKQQYRIR